MTDGIENPEILSAKWNLEEAELKGWDENGDPTQLWYVDMPVNDSSQKLYYKADTETTGTLYAKEAGEYWLEIKDSAGETRGKMRLVAQYPYEAADYYISRAKKFLWMSETIMHPYQISFLHIKI